MYQAIDKKITKALTVPSETQIM